MVKAGKIVDGYFDGKTSPSRRENIVLEEELTLADIDLPWRRKWLNAIRKDFEEHWLCVGGAVWTSGPNHDWDWNNETFIFGHIEGDKRTEKEPIMFAKCAHGGVWYGINWNYLLDLKCEIRKECWKTWDQCAKEMGQTIKWNQKKHRIEYYDKSDKLVETC